MASDESHGMIQRPVTHARKHDQEPHRPAGIPHDLIYAIEDVPPWYQCLVYGFQHYLAMIGGTIAKPIILASFLCLEEHNPARGALVSTIIFMSGVITLLQSTIGVRLPIIQGGNFAYVVPTVVLLTTSYEPCSALPLANITVTEREELWQVRMREIQGAITVSAFFQVIIGFSGTVGVLLRWITPLTVVTTVTLVGLSLFDVASKEGSGHWGVCLLTVGLAVVFSQHMRDLDVPFPVYKRGKGLSSTTCQPFKTLSLLMAIIISWGFCGPLDSV